MERTAIVGNFVYRLDAILSHGYNLANDRQRDGPAMMTPAATHEAQTRVPSAENKRLVPSDGAGWYYPFRGEWMIHPTR